MLASAAILAVLTSSNHQAFSNTQSNGMELYFEKGAWLKEISTTLSPHAKEYQPKPVQQYAYRNATQDNSLDSQLNKTLVHEKTSSKPLLDPHVQLTNANVI